MHLLVDKVKEVLTVQTVVEEVVLVLLEIMHLIRIHHLQGFNLEQMVELD